MPLAMLSDIITQHCICVFRNICCSQAASPILIHIYPYLHQYRRHPYLRIVVLRETHPSHDRSSAAVLPASVTQTLKDL